MSFALDFIPELDGAVAEFDNDEYIELYQDPLSNLSSAVWSTDLSAEVFIKEVSSILGDPPAGKRAALRLMGEGMRKFAANRALAYVAINNFRVAFCRVDFGSHSIIWTYERDERIAAEGNESRSLQGQDEAGLIFQMGDTTTAVKIMERTGTYNVRDYAIKALPRLVEFIHENLTNDSRRH